MNKKYIPLIVFFVLWIFPFPNIYAEDALKASDKPQQYSTLEVVFVKDMANKGLSFLSDSSVTLDQRKEAFRKLFRDNFDVMALGKFAIGAYWKSMSDTQKQTYLEMFEDYTVNVYSRRFQEYNGQRLEFVNKTETIGSDVMVSSFLVPKSGNKISVVWRVKNKDGQYKIIDIVVNGVSMAVTQRSDFSSTIQRGGGGVEILFEKLKERNAK